MTLTAPNSTDAQPAAPAQELTVEIWSDVVCPWCYIGKRRFETALAQFPHRDRVKVVWRSFQLDPSAPRRVEGSVADHLARKYGRTLEQAEEMNRRVTELAAAEGLSYRLDRAQLGNTFDAHRLIHLAAARGLGDAAHERLMKAYFSEGVAIGDPESLVAVIAEIGIDPEEARAVLAGDAYAAEVEADLRRAAAFGVTGVPFFALDEKYGISGGQPAELFFGALEQAWADSHPLTLVNGAADAACEDGACAVPWADRAADQ